MSGGILETRRDELFFVEGDSEVEVMCGNFTPKYLEWLESLVTLVESDENIVRQYYYKPTPDVMVLINGKLHMSLEYYYRGPDLDEHHMDTHMSQQIYDCCSKPVRKISGWRFMKKVFEISAENLGIYLQYAQKQISATGPWYDESGGIYVDDDRDVYFFFDSDPKTLCHPHLPLSNVKNTSLSGEMEYAELGLVDRVSIKGINYLKCIEFKNTHSDLDYSPESYEMVFASPDDMIGGIIKCQISNVTLDRKLYALNGPFAHIFYGKLTKSKIKKMIELGIYQIMIVGPRDKKCGMSKWIQDGTPVSAEDVVDWSVYPKMYLHLVKQLFILEKNIFQDIYSKDSDLAQIVRDKHPEYREIILGDGTLEYYHFTSRKMAKSAHK